MWCIAEKKICDTFVSGIHSRYCFLEFQAFTPYQKLKVAESGSTHHPLCIMVASCPSLRCSCRKKPFSCREAEGLVTELWSPGVVTLQWLCSQLCYETAANQQTLVENKVLARVGWKCGCQPFSCPCAENVMHCRKQNMRHICFRNPFPLLLFGIPSIHSLPEAWGSWEPEYPPPVAHYGCIIPIPSLQLQKKTILMQRSRRFGHGVVVSQVCYIAVIVLSVVLWDCCNANQRTLVEIELLATGGWKRGLQPFSCRCSQMWCTAEKRSMRHVCLRNPNSRHSFWEFLRAAVRSTSSALCFYYACNRFFAFVEDSGFVSHAEKHRSGHGVVVSKVCYGIYRNEFRNVFFPICHVDYCNMSRLSF